jgi:aldehyde:ferredoxin oxidoreductase
MREMKDFPVAAAMRQWGTNNETEGAIVSGDAPIKNWGGSYPEDFSNAEALNGDNVIKYQEKRYGCRHCPAPCGGHCKVPDGPYAMEGHKPEYETVSVFGNNLLNDNLESIFKANELCNQYGIDTISVGATIGFAMDCYEKGIISKADTDGIELTWGNHQAIVQMTEKICKGEGFGEVLSNGSKIAAEKIGGGSEEYAIQIGGQELPMHDGKLYPGLATQYQYNSTPGRHTQACEDWGRIGIHREDRKFTDYAGRGKDHLVYAAHRTIVDCEGLCYYSTYYYNAPDITEYMTAVTGWDYTMDNCTLDGERVMTLRSLFNLREGINPREWKLPGRSIGEPALKAGPLKGVTLDMETMAKDFYDVLGWDINTSVPSRESLERLGLDEVYDKFGGL